MVPRARVAGAAVSWTPNVSVIVGSRPLEPASTIFRLGMIVFRNTECSSSTNGTKYT
jgi:hypothetical protein